MRRAGPTRWQHMSEKASVIYTGWVCVCRVQWNRTGSPETDLNANRNSEYMVKITRSKMDF